MRLNRIYRDVEPLLDNLLRLYGVLTEEPGKLVWPQTWADTAFNDRRFKNWLKSLGFTGPIGKPMVGGVGRAYPIGDNAILKFTTDAKEARAAAVLVGHNSPHAADIYGVHLVATHQHPNDPRRNLDLYAIVMQRLNTGVGGRMRAAGTAVWNYLDKMSGFIEEPEATIQTIMDRYIGTDKDRHDPHMRTAVRKLVMALYNLQQQTGVLSQDPHGANLAFKGRESAFFDFGRSKSDHPQAKNARITKLPK